MAFSSLDFMYGFLPVVVLVYVLLPARLRNATILTASIVFYAWSEGLYTAVLVLYILVNWTFGIIIQKSLPGTRRRKVSVALAVIANLAGLIGFKYLSFIVDQVCTLLLQIEVSNILVPRLHLPIGISFFVFQGISYVVDVGSGQVKAADNIVTFGAYKAFFPQLIAGPIVRYRTVSADFNSDHDARGEDLAAGIRRFAAGLAKKVLVANTLAVPADSVFACPPEALSSPMMWYGAICYALQIYFDFSGYSDMAIGLGRVFGIHFQENFCYPYMARSVRDFWKRWHISLSTWFRDYLYIPLGGSQGGKVRTVLNLWVVFLACGFWHGAEWTFVAWGAWHGVFLAFEHLVHAHGTRDFGRPIRLAGHLYAALVVLVGWVLFRSATLHQAVGLIAVMLGLQTPGTPEPLWIDLANGQVVVALVAGVLGSTEMGRRTVMRFSVDFRNTLAVMAIGASTLVLASSAFNPFIYFRF